MKSNFTYLIGIALLCNFNITAQNFVDGGEYKFNESKTPCLTEVQQAAVKSQIRNGMQKLHQEDRLAYNAANRGSHPLFIWPVKKAEGFSYNDVWSISNYVDHNANVPDQLEDYNCGARSYDLASGYNHSGVDIFTWPFGWRMMDNDEVEIVAAAAGQILYKFNGSFDRNCGFNNDFWNTVYVQHTDGSAALYGHMKQNSLTTKNVGDMVAAGEYLGVVGSSGSSSGPHLHFEVYSEIEWQGSGQDVLVDPYAGPCNTMNPDTWWQDQKPYNNPNVNAVLTHSAPPIFPACPTQEITNESDDFDTGDQIYFALYMRDQSSGTSVNLKITKPDNTVLYNWNFPFTDNYVASYWYWNYSGVFNTNGQWKWEAEYQGQTVTHTFNITGVLGIDEQDFNSTSIYPNPFKNLINISSNSVVEKATITDMLGKIIMVFNTNSVEGIKEINLDTLSNGMYFLTLEGDRKQRKTIKLIKE